MSRERSDVVNTSSRSLFRVVFRARRRNATSGPLFRQFPESGFRGVSAGIEPSVRPASLSEFSIYHFVASDGIKLFFR